MWRFEYRIFTPRDAIAQHDARARMHRNHTRARGAREIRAALSHFSRRSFSLTRRADRCVSCVVTTLDSRRRARVVATSTHADS